MIRRSRRSPCRLPSVRNSNRLARRQTRLVLLMVAGCVGLTLVGPPEAVWAKRYGPAFIKRFSLSEQQVEKLEAIKDFRSAAREKERVVRHEINRLVNSDGYDEGELARLADRLSALIRANLLADAVVAREFYLALDEEQRELWAAHESKGTQTKKLFRKDREGRRGQQEESPPGE
jgi:Spy/CpxP family protein refolding chaperone